jgi:hypothetical protein
VNSGNVVSVKLTTAKLTTAERSAQEPSLPESITTFCPVTLSLRQKSTT